MLRPAITLLCCILGVPACGSGQSTSIPPQAEAGTSTPSPAYDVVVIKPVKGEPTSGGYGDLPDGFAMRGLPLKVLITEAYGLRNDQLSGAPGWASSLRFDIEAKMDPEASVALHKLPKQQQEVQRRLMLQSLLAERFKLQVHSKTEVRTTYELVLAKNGPKMSSIGFA